MPTPTASWRPGCPRRPRCSWAGAPRRCSPPLTSCRSSNGSRVRPAARSPSSATPTTSPPSWSTPTSHGGVNRASLGVQSTSAHVLAALGRTHDRANVERAVEQFRASGLAHVQPRPDLRRGRRVAGGLVPHARRRHRPRPAPRVGLRPHRGGGHAARGRSRPPPRRRRPGRQVPGGHRAPRRGRPRLVRDLELGPPGARVPPQPPLLDDGGVPGVGCAAHSHRDGRRFWNLRTPDRYVAAVAEGAIGGGGRRAARRRGPRPRGAPAAPPHP